MRTLAAIDPGNSSGLAIFMGGVLIHAETLQKDKLLSVLGEFLVDELVMEIPQIYTTGKGKGDPNKLLFLAYQIGQIQGATGLPATILPPAKWKGQVPKSVHHERVRSHLLPDELEIWKEIGKSDGRDAVALGMYHLGRTGRGGVLP